MLFDNGIDVDEFGWVNTAVKTFQFGTEFTCTVFNRFKSKHVRFKWALGGCLGPWSAKLCKT